MVEKSPKVHVHTCDKDRLVRIQEEQGLPSMKEAMAFLLNVFEELEHDRREKPEQPPPKVEGLYESIPAAPAFAPIPQEVPVAKTVSPSPPVETSEIPGMSALIPTAPPSASAEVSQGMVAPPSVTLPSTLWCIHNIQGRIYSHQRLGPLVFVNQSDVQRLIANEKMYENAACMEVTVTPANAEDVFMQHEWMDVSNWPMPVGGVWLKEWMSGVRPVSI